MNAPVRHNAKDFFAKPMVQEKLKELVGKNAPAFATSVLQIVNSNSMLVNADPQTIFSAACMAATLNLPINNNLGFAYIVPYSTDAKDANGNKIPLLDANGNRVKKYYNGKEFPQYQKVVEAQFQLGYKGFVQLAQRSGQFSRIAATPVYQGQLISANPLLGYEFDWTIPSQGLPIGYVAFFKLLNGFTAELYMSKAEIEKHAGNYSQSFKSGYGVWKDNFDAMALKTVLKLLLSKQAPLSIDMQKAQMADQAVIRDVDKDEFDYIDHQESIADLEAPKPTLNDDEFNAALEQLNANAIDKAYILDGYSLTDAQRVAVEAQ
ncbi:putative recombinase - phage associated [Acinetobacter sp. KAM398]|uniref:recombinase RecT n=1 Tax=unclassified Acinetobacter TaxID=196816 RepID=UPI001F4133A2|nr:MULTISPECIES: recombinase RecT [unclassified Acinetobacter]GJC30224.1 putative recombinase - phage associated [Acinetobacter sp. KAM392]GJC33034.1 putative recombinase - phage associated [Acinetobacter sp. KAM393]GJC35863.1 putative recombinase - phage associated [Acinetobacter sp. KAM394]GJC38562.1 putative recombinase - phage associated [Acinetobacter sp. KAM395]GJC41387.1 putative recombinase - phage associated [Acinetobacter sp. KAM396]